MSIKNLFHFYLILGFPFLNTTMISSFFLLLFHLWSRVNPIPVYICWFPVSTFDNWCWLLVAIFIIIIVTCYTALCLGLISSMTFLAFLFVEVIFNFWPFAAAETEFFYSREWYFFDLYDNFLLPGIMVCCFGGGAVVVVVVVVQTTNRKVTSDNNREQ